VKFTASRSESFLSDYQGKRPPVTEVELALRSDGSFLALRASNLSNIGARCIRFRRSPGLGLVTGAYDIPAATLRSRAASPTRRRPIPTAAPGAPR